jgi:Flp pilus assembly protein TadB
MNDQRTDRNSGGATANRMRFSLRWLFLITTYVAIATAGVVLGPPWLWFMFLVVILMSHIHRWREQRSNEAEAWYKAHPELLPSDENNIPTT